MSKNKLVVFKTKRRFITLICIYQLLRYVLSTVQLLRRLNNRKDLTLKLQQS